jgi:hypothetical protein
MTIRRKTLMSITVAVVLLTTTTLLVSAQASAGVYAPVGTPGAVLPPLPEWPIIGPVLRFLGLVKEAAPEVLLTPDPGLPEYRITSLEDIDQLHDIEANERVRIIATDTDLNQMIHDLLSEAGYSEDASLKVAFNDPMITAEAYAGAGIIERIGVDIPASLHSNFDILATFTVEAGNCSVTVAFEKVGPNSWGANSWSFGLRSVANQLVNEQIPRLWPEEFCAESVIVMDGEAAVEGYLRR